MATTPDSFDAFREAEQRLWISRGLTALVLLGVAVGIWFAANHHSTVIKREAPISLLMPVAAPPPPPPPPKPVQQETTPTITPEQTPTQQMTPKDNALTMNAEGQGAGDAFGIGAGTGEGMRGSGVAGDFSRNIYARYLVGAIRDAVRDSNLQNKTFRVEVSLWFSPQGKITRAEIRKGTGSPQDDRQIVAFLMSLPQFDQPPPQSLLDTQPVEMTIDLRRAM